MRPADEAAGNEANTFFSYVLAIIKKIIFVDSQITPRPYSRSSRYLGEDDERQVHDGMVCIRDVRQIWETGGQFDGEKKSLNLTP